MTTDLIDAPLLLEQPLQEGTAGLQLDAAHHAALAAARGRAKKIRRAAGVANFNGWVTAMFALISLPFAVQGPLSFLVAGGLVAVAYHEFRGRRMLLAFDPNAATRLGWNQLGFLALIVVYCAVMLFSTLTTTSPIVAEFQAKPELRQALGSPEQLDQLYKATMVAVYVLVMVLSLIFQGVNAAYYFTRRKWVVSYLQQTPDWVQQIQRTTSGSPAID